MDIRRVWLAILTGLVFIMQYSFAVAASVQGRPASLLASAATVPQAATAGITRIEVPLLTHGETGLAVPVMLQSQGTGVLGTFLVDTGATYTVISPRMASKLGVEITPDTPRVNLITLQGILNAPLVRIPKLCLGDLTRTNVAAIVHPLGNDVLLAGLLGMNVFEGLGLSVHQRRLILELPHS
jgi:clan AA aspartic protease (TIGR02281 family)